MVTEIKVPSETREKVLLGARMLYWAHWGRPSSGHVTDFRDDYHREAYQCISLMELADAKLRDGQSQKTGRYTPDEIFDRATSRFWDVVTGHQEYMDARERETLRRLAASGAQPVQQGK